MDLLPKSHEEFAQADYWNAFFRKRGDKAFEWYGEYLELCDQIHKYVKPSDKILMLGCGNSKLSMDMYDSGFKDITNIDISPVAIKKMLDTNSITRPDMKFIQMDATAMTFPEETFSVALDKGTLDALFVDDTEEVRSTIDKYFKEITRTMRMGGRYLCISLLQEHILKYILEFFPKQSFMVRIVHCWQTDKANQEKNRENPDTLAMPVFMLVATKFKALPMPILEFSTSNDKMQRIKTFDELVTAVTSVQRAALVCNGLARGGNIAGHKEVTMELHRPGASFPRYTIYILDQPPSRLLGRYAVFIVPQGREVEWLFSTPEGRKKLQESCGHQRLAIVTLHFDEEYESLDAVKAELAESVKSLAPMGLKETILFLSLGSDVGKRETLVSGSSKLSGDFRVEDVEGSDGKTFRRLIFLKSQNVVQSEALIKTIKPKGKKERKKVDIGYLACNHHIYMSVGVQMSMTMRPSCKAEHRVLVIGLGGGGLCNFLRAAMPQNVIIVAVEIDPIMLEVAEEYFELRQDKRLTVVIDEGVSFLQQCVVEGISFDAVLLDVDSKDLSLGISCPPPSFLEPEVLENVKKIMGPKGLFVLNLVARNEQKREQIVKELRDTFKALCSYKLEEDLNEVLYCANDENFKQLNDWKKMLGASGIDLNGIAKDKNLVTKNLLDITEFLRELKI